jgi:hypothetical protein
MAKEIVYSKSKKSREPLKTPCFKFVIGCLIKHVTQFLISKILPDFVGNFMNNAIH